jgi:hypothetical protein
VFHTWLYVDGTLQGEGTGGADIPDAATPLQLGVSSNNNTPYRGHLAHVAFFSRALSATEIANLAAKF